MSHQHNDTQFDGFQQPNLFLDVVDDSSESNLHSVVVEIPAVTASLTLGGAALPYQDYLRRTGHSAYTVTCFLSDLRLLTEYLGSEFEAGRVTRAHLAEWVNYLKWDRKSRPAPKTLARRITFLKNFFGWLASLQIITVDPASAIPLSRPAPPLPEILFEDEVQRLERSAEDDVRCDLLVMLLLYAGLKKEEVMGLRLQDVDLSDAEHPEIEVHFPGQAKRRRERRMQLPGRWTVVYKSYLLKYAPQEYVFECTDRNLNYVLGAAVRRAGINKRVTLQLLRDIYAVRQLRQGMDMDVVRERLGLSEEAWYEIAEKYRKLAFPA